MRRLNFTADQFDSFVFQQVTTVAAENENEFETGLRLLRKLKDPALTEEVPPIEAEVKQQIRGRTKLMPFRRLKDGVAEIPLVLEEDEYNLLKKRIELHRTAVPTLAAEEFGALLDTIRSAVSVTPEVGQAKG